MPRTRSSHAPVAATGANGGLPPPEVFSLAEAAAYLRLGEDQVLGAVRGAGLPGRHFGSDWRFLKSAIQDWLAASVRPRSNKDVWLELAGVWQHDPLLDEELQTIHQRRGGPID